MRNEGQPIGPEQESSSLEQEPANLEQQQRDLIDQIKEARKAKDTQKLVDLFGQLEAISLPPKEKEELDPEVLAQNQKVYDFLGIEINLTQEYEQGNILLPTTEQREAAEKEGYTEPIIVLGDISREQIIDAVKTKYASQFKTEGIFYGDQAKQDLDKTQVAIQNPRPAQPYILYLKPENLREAHPETMNKTFPQCLEILKTEQQKHSQANLKGLTLQEALITDASSFLLSGKHLDESPWAWYWLLEEQVLDDSGQPIRCLDAFWSSGDRGVYVYSDSSESHDGHRGARFAALPRQSGATAGSS